MRRTIVLLSLLALTGCSGLSVSWHMTASYKTLVQTRTLTEHAPPAPEEDKPVPPPPLPAGKAS